MKRQILFILMLLHSFLGNAQMNEKTLEEIEQLRTDETKPIVVLFSTDWCGVCYFQKKNLKKLPKEFWDKIYFTSINPEKYKKEINFLGKKYSFIANGSSGVHQIAYEWAGNRSPHYPFWVFIDDKNQISTYEGLLRVEELENIF